MNKEYYVEISSFEGRFKIWLSAKGYRQFMKSVKDIEEVNRLEAKRRLK